MLTNVSRNAPFILPPARMDVPVLLSSQCPGSASGSVCSFDHGKAALCLSWHFSHFQQSLTSVNVEQLYFLLCELSVSFGRIHRGLTFV